MDDGFLKMDDNQIQLSPDNRFLDDLLNSFNEFTDYEVEFVTNPTQDSIQDCSALPEEVVEDSIPMDGGVPPLPSTGDELTTNPQSDSAHHHHIIVDPIFETFFKNLDESPRSPTSDALPLQDNLSDSVEPSKPTPHSTQQHPPPTSQSLEVPVISTSQALQNVSNQQHFHAQLSQPKPTSLQSSGHNHQIIQSPTFPNKRQKTSSKRCGCKASKCQQRYCGCYAAGELCGENCSCQGCFNKSEYDATKPRNNNMCHNPQAMSGAPTPNPITPHAIVQIDSVAHPQANSFTTSSNIISPPQAVQMAAMAQLWANPFTTSSNISPPQAVQMAAMAQLQANQFTTSSRISPPQAVQMAAMARLQADPIITYYQPQQQHIMMYPANPQQMGHRVLSVNAGSRSPLMRIPPRLRQEAHKIWKQLPRK